MNKLADFIKFGGALWSAYHAWGQHDTYQNELQYLTQQLEVERARCANQAQRITELEGQALEFKTKEMQLNSSLAYFEFLQESYQPLLQYHLETLARQQQLVTQQDDDEALTTEDEDANLQE